MIEQNNIRVRNLKSDFFVAKIKPVSNHEFFKISQKTNTWQKKRRELSTEEKKKGSKFRNCPKLNQPDNIYNYLQLCFIILHTK